jgi:hypothetical protein
MKRINNSLDEVEYKNQTVEDLEPLKIHDRNNVICKQIDISEYMTLEEFRKELKEMIVEKLNEHGVYK